MAEEKKENGGKEKRPTASKRDLQSKRRNLRNRSFKSAVATAVRSFKESVAQKDVSGLKIKLNTIYSLVDKGVKKGIFKLNKANRIKSRLHALTK